MASVLEVTKADVIYFIKATIKKMITSRSTFEYQGEVLIEKMKIRAPFLFEANFQNSGCFIYFKERGPKLITPRENTQLQGNEAVLLKCGNHFLDLFRETNDNLVEVTVIHLFPDLLKKLYTGDISQIVRNRNVTNSSQIVASSDVIKKFIESLDFYFQNPSLVTNDLLELKIKELILLLLQSKNIASILALVADLYSSNTVQLREVIDLHIFSNLKVAQLAKLCNLSLSSFKREFKKEFNNSPTNYINDKKIEKAQELLTITNLSVSEIAYEIGFQDSLYFTRLFKNKTGVPPTIYRKNHMN